MAPSKEGVSVGRTKLTSRSSKASSLTRCQPGQTTVEAGVQWEAAEWEPEEDMAYGGRGEMVAVPEQQEVEAGVAVIAVVEAVAAAVTAAVAAAVTAAVAAAVIADVAIAMITVEEALATVAEDTAKKQGPS
jgi:Na+(H+)/acetate symporter ActP